MGLTVGMKVLEGIRGGWLGFNRGLYKRANSSPMSKHCMDNEAADHLTASFHQFKKDGIVEGDWLDALGNLTKVAANLTECNFRDPFRDIWKFCKAAHATQKKHKEEEEAEKKAKEEEEAEDAEDAEIAEEDDGDSTDEEEETEEPVVKKDHDESDK